MGTTRAELGEKLIASRVGLYDGQSSVEKTGASIESGATSNSGPRKPAPAAAAESPAAGKQ